MGSLARFNPSPGLEKIEATVLAINADDDERNLPETGVTDAALKCIRNAKLYLIPASTETRGHLTTGNARFYRQHCRNCWRPRRSERCDQLISHCINLAGARCQHIF